MDIAVLVNQVEGSFFSAQWRTLHAWAQENDVRLFFITGKALQSPVPMEFSHNIVYDLVVPGSIDGMLVYSGSLGNYTGPVAVEALLKRLPQVPIVTLNSPVSDYMSVSVDSSYGISDLVKHFVVDHNFRVFGLVTGELTNFDASERHKMYLKSLAYHGVDSADVTVFNGNFSPESGSSAADYYFQNGLPDAILCANDDMAHSLINRLAELGVCVPEDIAVAGFDGLDFGGHIFPALTTVKQPHDEVAICSANLLLKKIKGQVDLDVQDVKCAFVRRQSCGCMDSLGHQSLARIKEGCSSTLERGAESDFFNSIKLVRSSIPKGEIPIEIHDGFLSLMQRLVSEEDETFRQTLANKIYQYYFFNFTAAQQLESTHAYELFMYQWKFRNASRAISADSTMPDLLRSLEFYVPYLNLKFCRILLLPRKLKLVDFAQNMPSHLKLFFEFNAGSVTVSDEEGVDVPIDYVFSQEDKSHVYIGSSIIKPLFYGDEVVGVLQLGAENNIDMLFESFRELISITLRHIHLNLRMQEANLRLEFSLAETSLMNRSLREQSIHDELTGLLNRRGFFKLSEEVLNADVDNQLFHLVYIDMDGLKAINDVHGHHEGDWAIEKFSNALKASFRANDIVSRIGGDEFTVLVQNQDIEYSSSIRSRIQKHLDHVNAVSGKPFKLLFSMGSIPFTTAQTRDVNLLMENADSMLYREKNKKKLQ